MAGPQTVSDALFGGLGETASSSSAGATAVPLMQRHDRCNEISFADFCQWMEEMSTKTGSQEKLNCILNKSLSEKLRGESPYPLVRLMVPSSDKSRASYGIQERTIGDLYIKALGITDASTDAREIKDWKTNKLEGVAEDVSEFIYLAVNKRLGGVKTIVHTIKDVNDLLDDFAKTRGGGGRFGSRQVDQKDTDKEDKSKGKGDSAALTLLKERVVMKFPALEQKWLIRIILANSPSTGMKIGIKCDSILNHYNPASLEKYNECCDLRKALEEWGMRAIVVGESFKPMLSKYLGDTSKLGMIGTAVEAMGKNPFVIDTKIDGERFCYHFQRVSGGKPQISSFSRNCNSSSDLFRPLNEDIARCLPSWVDKIIIDGEVVGWDLEEHHIASFGSIVTLAKMEGGMSNNRLENMKGDNTGELPDDLGSKRFCLKLLAFDIVYLAGKPLDGLESIMKEGANDVERRFGIKLTEEQKAGLVPGRLTHLPLALRRLLLRRALQEKEDRVEFCENEEVISVDNVTRCRELSRQFERIVMRNEEGVVVKDLSSGYILGEASRQSKTAPWVKLKPDYNDQVDMCLLCGVFHIHRILFSSNTQPILAKYASPNRWMTWTC